jgi:hypothetical protein
MKRHRRTIVLGIVIFLALVVGVALVLRRPSSTKELDAYKAELRAKGEKLSVKELTAGHSTNGLDQLNELLAIAASLPRAQDVPIMNLMQGVDTGKARVAWTERQVPLARARGTETWETVTTQLDSMKGLLVELRKAIQQPDLASAWDPAELQIGHTSTAQLIAKRIAAQTLAGATIVEMHRGRLTDASENLHALAMLAVVDRDNPSLIQQMIRVAIARLSISATWQLLQTNGWNDVQLARMQTDLEQLHLAAGNEKAWVGDRARFLGHMEAAVQSGSASATGVTATDPFFERVKDAALLRLWDPADDELFYLQNIQITLESLRALEARQPRANTKDKFDENAARLARMGMLAKHRYLISAIAMPNLNQSIDTLFRTETERELTITAIALKRFQLRHNRPAPDLAALVPEFLPLIPYDPLSGKSLVYRLNPDGTFVLYSVGEDGKDNGGDSAVARPEAPRDMWRGRDAVWPVPVW